MPYKYAKRLRNKKLRRPARKGSRKLYVASQDRAKYSMRPTTRPTAKRRGNLRGRNPYDQGTRGPKGAAAVDAASGSAGTGFRVGKVGRMGKIMMNRKKRILNVLADQRYPVIKHHSLDAADQIDWASNAQAVVEYQVGYTTQEMQQMLDQSNAAQNVSLAALVIPNSSSLTNQKMDYYAKTSKINMKNTCSHTVYLEVVAYKCKGYHSFTMTSSWATALVNDNMVQNPAQYGTEETRFNIGNRPNMALPHLGVRYSRDARSVYKIALEPGQETSYTYVQHGGRFDQMRFNVAQGSEANAVDVVYGPFSTALLVFARAEMVADALDNDVTYGSGHVSVNIERRKSFSAVPYMKPMQASFENNWGNVVEANELDLNQYQANNDVYEEQV